MSVVPALPVLVTVEGVNAGGGPPAQSRDRRRPVWFPARPGRLAGLWISRPIGASSQAAGFACRFCLLVRRMVQECSVRYSR